MLQTKALTAAILASTQANAQDLALHGSSSGARVPQYGNENVGRSELLFGHDVSPYVVIEVPTVCTYVAGLTADAGTQNYTYSTVGVFFL